MSALLNTIWNVYVCSKKGKSNLLSIIFATFYYFINNFNEHKTESPENFQKGLGKSPDLA